MHGKKLVENYYCKPSGKVCGSIRILSVGTKKVKIRKLGPMTVIQPIIRKEHYSGIVFTEEKFEFISTSSAGYKTYVEFNDPNIPG